MLVNNLSIKNFSKDHIKNKHKQNRIKIFLKKFLSKKNEILLSLGPNYKDSYSKKLIKKLKKYEFVNLIGMGGSILGAKAIHSFLKSKFKINFIDDYFNLPLKKNLSKKLNIIISKSGNTLEVIANANLLSAKSKNILITENKKNYLYRFAKELKAEIVHHNNFIGGRYSVLSEVGMLPAELMGFSSEKFRGFNKLIKDNKFLDLIVNNVLILDFFSKKKLNSVIINYDSSSNDLFNWYQQLVAESLGKRGKGFLPIISSMPKDNHSVMQYYLDGPKNYFFTFFFVQEKNSQKIYNQKVLGTHKYLKNKNFNDLSYAQFTATQRVFKANKIPFRSFLIKKRCEESLGKMFTFFMLETILLGKIMKLNPFDQPAVELIKNETKKILINS
ncbi:glucose-6-phosphate isomerase [Candidatus Pelagibacter sp.]|nr:glucose-6-phosphate isomerase [Candidatus Pelagibacter sp.]